MADHAAAQQHNLAGQQIGADHLASLSSITAPALVIHDTEEPILPPEHGEALAAQIPHAQLRIIEEMGHGFFVPGLPRRLTQLILDHVPTR